MISVKVVAKRKFINAQMILSVAIGAMVPVGNTVSAQEDSQSAICMISSVNVNLGRGRFIAAIPPHRRAYLESKGFVAYPCGGILADIEKYKQRVCGMGDSKIPDASSIFAISYGISAEELCSFSNEIK